MVTTSVWWRVEGGRAPEVAHQLNTRIRNSGDTRILLVVGQTDRPPALVSPENPDHNLVFCPAEFVASFLCLKKVFIEFFVILRCELCAGAIVGGKR